MGKSTFLAALVTMDPSSAYFFVPPGKDEDISTLMDEAQKLRRDPKITLPSSTTIRQISGEIVLPNAGKVLVSFLDFPGSDFSAMYDLKDQGKAEEVRQFVHDSEYIYFLVEPKTLQSPKEIELEISRFLDVLRDYRKGYEGEKKKDVGVCLALTKADSVENNEEIRSGEANREQIREYFEQCDPKSIEVLRNELGKNNLFFAAFSTRREDRYGLSEQDFINLFTPVARDIKRKEIVKKIRRLALVFFGIILCIGSLYCLKRYSDIQADNQKKTELCTPVSERNYREVLEKLERTKDPELRAHYMKGIEVLKKNKEEQLERAFSNAKGVPGHELYLKTYIKACGEYEEMFGSIPQDLSLPLEYAQVPLIDAILSVVASKEKSNFEYLRGRVSAVRSYLHGNVPDKEEIKKALECAATLLEGKFKLKVRLKLKKALELSFWVMSGRIDLEDERKKAKLGMAEQKEFNRDIDFEWKIGDPLELHVWRDPSNWELTTWGNQCSKIMGVGKENLAVGFFCELTRILPSNIEPGDDKFIENIDTFSTTVCSAKDIEIKKQDMERVVKYILTNDYWKERKQEIEEKMGR